MRRRQHMGCRAATQPRESTPQEGGSCYTQVYFLGHMPLQQGLLVVDTGGKCAAMAASSCAVRSLLQLPLAGVAASCPPGTARQHRGSQPQKTRQSGLRR